MQDQQVVNVLKGLVIDGVNAANSGHPGGPMSSMDLTYILYREFLNFDPDDPEWLGRDRFILSAGHMSMLLYSCLTGVGWLEIDDLKKFRQLHSKTPGHPENFQTPGVECTTGPLGQGAAMSLGFAVAQNHLHAKLDQALFNYRTWAIVSDGDLQEGVAMATASLAGHLQTNNLVWIYDKNHVQLSGPTKLCESDDFKSIYEGLGWTVLEIDGHNHDEIRAAYTKASQVKKGPTLIIATTVIGKGCATMENSSKTHGSPLPSDERKATKQNLGLPDEDFYWPAAAKTQFQAKFDDKRAVAKAWRERFTEQRENNSDFATAWQKHFERNTYDDLPSLKWDASKPIATRNAFGDIIEAWADDVPNLIGGSADLEPSNMTGAFAKKVGVFDRENRGGRNINYGVREFPMSALNNGIALHGGLIPFDATFLSFADYSRPALRLGAIQKVRVIHEFTHDSFHLGEDGPTHQPVEQVMALRTIPDFYVFRPADAKETEVLMRHALSMTLPSALCLTRQKLPHMQLSDSTVAKAVKGAYPVKDVDDPELILIATGSEVSLALEVAERYQDRRIRVVSMPCWELFAEQPADYRDSVLPPACKKRVSIEAGTTLGWERYAGSEGLVIGLDHFGASAPAGVLAKEYGFTADQVAKRIEEHGLL